MKINTIIKPGVLMASAAALSLAACSSNPNKTEADAAAQAIKKDQVEAQQKEAEENISMLPDWYMNRKSMDDHAFYGVGLGEDFDLNDAIRKARLQAYYEIAKNMKSELAGEETMTGNAAGEYRMVINQFVDATPMSGADNVKTEVKARNGKYQVYVMLMLPHDRIHKYMELQQEQRNRDMLEESYQRLMKKLAERREQRIEDEKRRQERLERLAQANQEPTEGEQNVVTETIAAAPAGTPTAGAAKPQTSQQGANR